MHPTRMFSCSVEQSMDTDIPETCEREFMGEYHGALHELEKSRTNRWYSFDRIPRLPKSCALLLRTQ